MNIDSSAFSARQSNELNAHEKIKTLDEMASKEASPPNFGFTIMYEEWKQNILLSNGIKDDENADW
ncbi:hypothetical protein [Cedecea sp. FDAARGOS_727]|uniref:hypothetical protein n=1 Tax=Cedecea sp. FDAARGOS_727 TaxID=2545798 RepID=UPI00143E435C|nr:hypothetical protein [Cedecea sp. FDAARGOS_727]QIX96607.1 hypothetical protein FOC35_13345 [Cedecea sp. FDAARGOS_727]